MGATRNPARLWWRIARHPQSFFAAMPADVRTPITFVLFCTAIALLGHLARGAWKEPGILSVLRAQPASWATLFVVLALPSLAQPGVLALGARLFGWPLAFASSLGLCAFSAAPVVVDWMPGFHWPVLIASWLLFAVGAREQRLTGPQTAGAATLLIVADRLLNVPTDALALHLARPPW